MKFRKFFWCLLLILFGLAVGLSASAADSGNNQDQTLNFNNNDFGVYGPLSFSGTYSSKFGGFFHFQWVNYITPLNAFAFELGFGSKEFRIGGTWGHTLTAKQRFKLTLEHLANDLTFNFASGDSTQWMGQNAAGAAYQYLLNNHFFNSVNVDAYYSHADSETLSSKQFTYQGAPATDIRRIAGSKAYGGSAGFGMNLWPESAMTLALNYDRVIYNTDYVAGDNSAGVGGTVDLTQLFGPNWQLNLSASDRQPWSRYAGGLNWLLHTRPGTRLVLGVHGSFIHGNLPESDDARALFSVAYSWDGPHQLASGFSIAKPGTPISLASWVATPAVEMPQVLVMQDEHIDTGSLNPLALNAGLTASAMPTLVVKPGQPVALSLAKYFHASGSQTVSYSLQNNLPPGLVFDPQTGVISGVVSEKLLGQTYTVNVQAQPVAQMMSLASPGQMQNLSQPVTENLKIAVESVPQCTVPTDIYRYDQVPINGSNAINIGAYCTGGDLTYKITQVNGPAQLAIDQNSGVITGPAQAVSYSVVNLMVSNGAGYTLPTFNLHVIKDPNPVSQPIPGQWASLGSNFSINVTAPNFGDFHTEVGSLQFSLKGNPSWLAINQTTGVIAGTPPIGTTDTLNITVTGTQIENGTPTGRTTSETLNIYILPTYNGVLLPIIVGTGDPINVQTHFFANGPETLSYGVSADPDISGLSVNATGKVTGTAPTLANTYQVSVTATKTPVDVAPGMTTETFPVTVINHPSGQNFGPIWVNFNNSENPIFTASTYFQANSGNLTYQFVNAPSWLSINATTGAVDLTANKAADTKNIEIKATQFYQGHTTGLTASADFDLLVNPTANQSSLDETVVAGQTMTVDASKLFNAYGGSLTYNLEGNPSWVSLSGTTLTIAPSNQIPAGKYSLTLNAIKASGHQASITVNITIYGTFSMNCPLPTSNHVPTFVNANSVYRNGVTTQVNFDASDGPGGTVQWYLRKTSVNNGTLTCEYGLQYQVTGFRKLTAGSAQDVKNITVQSGCNGGSNCVVQFNR